MAVFLPLSQCEKIQTQMERSKAKFWWVSDSDNTLIAENEEESMTMEDSFNSLVDVLDNLEGDWVYVTIRNKLPNKDEAGNFKRGANIKGIQKFEYRVRLKQANGQGAGRMQAISGTGMNEAIGGLYLQIGDLKAQMIEKEKNAIIAGLEEKLRAKKDGSVTDRLIETVADKFVKAWNIEVEPTVTKQPVADGQAPAQAPANKEKQLTDDEAKKKSAQLSQNLKDLGNVLGARSYDFLADMAQRAKDNPEFFKLFAEASIKKELNLKDLVK